MSKITCTFVDHGQLRAVLVLPPVRIKDVGGLDVCTQDCLHVAYSSKSLFLTIVANGLKYSPDNFHPPIRLGTQSITLRYMRGHGGLA